MIYIAEMSPEALDIPEGELAQRIVAEEQERLAREAMARRTSEPR
jgi:hypothetical protein